MKTTLQSLFALLFFLSCLNIGQAQSHQRPAADSRQPLPAINVDIKVYQCPGGEKSLLAYDPNQHSLFIFSCEDYLVNWSRHGLSISQEAMLQCVGPGAYHVEVIHHRSGASASASIWFEGDNHRLKPQMTTDQ